MKTDSGSSVESSVVEIRGGSGEGVLFQPADNKGGRGMNVRQLTWVVRLRAHGAAHSVARLTAASWVLLQAGKKRLLNSKLQGGGEGGIATSGETKDKGGGSVLHFIRGFLAVCLAALAFELVGYWNGWSLTSDGGDEVLLPLGARGTVHAAYLAWISIRANYIAQPLQAVCNVCVVLFVIQSVDRLVFSLGCFWINFNEIKPAFRPQDSAGGGGDPSAVECGDELNGGGWYPMVLVQIPMCNEREVYEQSISAACQLDWPKDRFLVQVLDDSDDKAIQLMIRAEVEKWSASETNIVYRHRLVRTGYKAGNLKSAMSCGYVKDYEFVAIFDADFQPNPDFLKRTVPHFKDNPELGLVQARWNFVNKDQNLLTRLQYINMCYHFEVEQQVNGVFLNFFGFNGTAGVWRMQALEGSGGWLERTTVEDMDIAVRAHLNGWKFIFLNDVRVPCEVPELYEAYRKQQHRWHSGPMNLFRLCLPDIITSEISIWKKANIILLFFLLRKLILPLYSFVLVCIILPLTMFVPEAEIPIWVICHVPLIMSVLNVYPAPGSFPFVLPYLFFENTMSVTKFNAMISGLLQLRNSYEWVVTKKAGRSGESDHSGQVAVLSASGAPRPQRNRGTISVAADTAKVAELKRPKEAELLPTQSNKIYKKELAVALLLLIAAVRGLLSARPIHFYFLLFQGVAFLIVGLDLLGGQIAS